MLSFSLLPHTGYLFAFIPEVISFFYRSCAHKNSSIKKTTTWGEKHTDEYWMNQQKKREKKERLSIKDKENKKI